MNGRQPFPQLVVRPVEAGDAERVRRLFARLSPESVYRRFFTLFPTPPASILHHLVAVDHRDHEALAVLDGDEIVALASWDRPARGTADAEVAVLVEDAWQHHGLGRALVRMLAGRASREGIAVLNATILSDNYPARRLATTVAKPKNVVFDGPETSFIYSLAS